MTTSFAPSSTLDAPTSVPSLAPVPIHSAPTLTSAAPAIFTSSTTSSTVPSPSIVHSESGPNNRGMAMRKVTLEVPATHSLLRKTGGADGWLEPLIGYVERTKMQSHSCNTLMNDIVHSTLKVTSFNLTIFSSVILSSYF